MRTSLTLDLSHLRHGCFHPILPLDHFKLVKKRRRPQSFKALIVFGVSFCFISAQSIMKKARKKKK